MCEYFQIPLLTPALCPTRAVVYIPHYNSSWWELVDNPVDGGDWYRWIDGSSRGDICLFYFDRGYRDQLYIPALPDSFIVRIPAIYKYCTVGPHGPLGAEAGVHFALFAILAYIMWQYCKYSLLLFYPP